MRPTPAGWPRISQCVYYDDPRAAIDWLCQAFGFEVRLLVEGEGGRVEHSELTFGEGLIMVDDAQRGDPLWKARKTSPASIGGRNTQNVCIYVDDVDAHAARAQAAGAKIVREPKTDDYGDDYWSDRTYGAEDPEGHVWWFLQRVRDQRPRGQ